MNLFIVVLVVLLTSHLISAPLKLKSLFLQIVVFHVQHVNRWNINCPRFLAGLLHSVLPVNPDTTKHHLFS